MKKFLALILLFVGTLVYGQTSNVSATVTDSDSQTWNNGSYIISFVPPSGYTGSIYTFNGTPWTPPAPITGSLSISGVFTYNGLQRNDYILPAGSHWQFTFQPLASFGPSSTQLFINNGTMNIGSSLVLVAPRFPAGSLYGGSYGYLDVEISPTPPIGGFYYNVSLTCQRVWGGSSYACNNGNATIPTCSANQISYFNSDGSVLACLALGSGLSIDAGTMIGGITQLTGDASAGPGAGSQVITFATVNNGSGQCGDSTHVCQVTTNPKGLVTAQQAVSIAASGGGINQLTGDGTAGPGSGSQAFTLANANGSPGTCGDATHVCQLTSNAKGLISTQTQIAITAAGGITQLTGDASAGPGSGSQIATLATVNSSPGTCGDGTHTCQITTNSKGLTTAQTQVAITAAGITQLSGDATAGPGSGSQAITFASVNGGPGTCGDSTHVCQVTINAKGLTTSQSQVAIAASGGINQLTGDVIAGPGTGSQAATLPTVNSNVGSCGDSTHVAQVTLNAKGLTTACTPVSIAAAGGVTSVNSITGAVIVVGDSTITVTPSGGNLNLHVLGNSRVSYDILDGAPATPAAVLRNAVVSGTISSCQFVTTTSDGSTNLTFNLTLAGTSIFSGGGQTITAGTSSGTTSTLTLTGTIAVTAGQSWALSISVGTANWTGNLACH